MKRPFWFLTFAIAAVLAVSVRAADTLVVASFNNYLDALRIQTGIPGLAATIVSATDIAWENAFGAADVEHNVPMRTDTPIVVDGPTQTLVASLALRCHESGWISLDDPALKYAPTFAEPGATLRMLFTHTSMGPAGLTFAYRLDRLGPTADAVATCTGLSFRAGVAAYLERMGMFDTVPGLDAASLMAETEGFDAATLQRYADVLARLAVPYAVDGNRHATASAYPAKTLAPGGGLVTTARDLAKFDLALKSGVAMHAESLIAAWTPAGGAGGQPLPHGIGWFVQGYNGEPIVWQFGETGVSSSLVVIAPRRALTLILLANGPGLSQSFGLATGDLNTSPFARLFLRLFVR